MSVAEVPCIGNVRQGDPYRDVGCEQGVGVVVTDAQRDLDGVLIFTAADVEEFHGPQVGILSQAHFASNREHVHDFRAVVDHVEIKLNDIVTGFVGHGNPRPNFRISGVVGRCVDDGRDAEGDVQC